MTLRPRLPVTTQRPAKFPPLDFSWKTNPIVLLMVSQEIFLKGALTSNTKVQCIIAFITGLSYCELARTAVAVEQDSNDYLRRPCGDLYPNVHGITWITHQDHNRACDPERIQHGRISPGGDAIRPLPILDLDDSHGPHFGDCCKSSTPP